MNKVRSLLVAWGVCIVSFFVVTPVFAAAGVSEIQIKNVPPASYDAYKDPKESLLCTVYYKDGTTKNCKSSVTATAGALKDEGYRNICYSYTEGGVTGKDCTSRYYASSVKVIGDTQSHTGDHQYYQCVISYKNGNKITFNGNGGEHWTSSPYNFIGTDFKHVGYVNMDYGNKIVQTNATNEFYAGDVLPLTQTITCNPNFYAYPAYGESENTVKGSLSVKNVGVSYLYMTATGWFYDDDGSYKLMTITSKNGKPFEKSFIQGHYYDMAAFVYYTDGTKREITNSKDIHWKSSEGVTGSLPNSGYGFKIPTTDKSSLKLTFSLFGWSEPTVATREAKSYLSQYSASIPVHAIKSIEIRGKSLQEPPKTTLETKEVVYYTAWVHWSDEGKDGGVASQPQDWTKLVKWSGTYATTTPGKYDFNVLGMGITTNVTAQFIQPPESGATGSISKTITVHINGCDSDVLSYGCGIPKSDWTTQPQNSMGNVYSGFNGVSDTIMKNSNYLPPPSTVGSTKWTDKNHPYYFGYKFPVSGVNGGTKNR